MKILHAVLSRGFYGSERYCGELAAAQARDGHDVEVLVHDGWSDCAREMRKLIGEANPVGAGTMTLSAIPGWAPALLHRALARRALRRFRPDVVHTHLNPAARRVGREAQRLAIPHVATLHLSYAPREVGDCEGLVCIAEWQRATLGDYCGEVAVVHNWLPSAVANALSTTTGEQVVALRQSWRAGEKTFVFGSVGRLMPEKGMDRLIRAFRAAFAPGENVALVIAGAGPQQAELARLAAGDPRIVLAGAQENVAPFYLAFDAFVSAARFEPFGLAILEAMAAECPLVLTRTQGPPEFATDERVLWVEAEDDGMLAARLREAQARGWQRYRYDLKKFTQERAALEIEAFYRRIIARRRAQAQSA
ncbi:MAG TPA: glycosyltransferase family 4 protein [Xanthobacteraceae bacterium]|nr:glycosyltransferase family 4 protein [Xanthobacteraceae bacterium]